MDSLKFFCTATNSLYRYDDICRQNQANLVIVSTNPAGQSLKTRIPSRGEVINFRINRRRRRYAQKIKISSSCSTKCLQS